MPPAIKIQPRRPKYKKRKLEQGEKGAQSQSVQKPVKRRSTCNNCGQQGHYEKTCKNPTVTPLAVSSPKKGGGRPQSDSDWVKEQRKKKNLRALQKESALGATAGPNSIGNRTFPQEQYRKEQQQKAQQKQQQQQQQQQEQQSQQTQ
ncbi:ras-interacting protein RIP3-like [Chenopodium quinoa]|uniref:ras-interacting protein RIP3-like n=1 Tax=Chenopodium quinoa TaxID=63459 RepID=UPI000B77F258|nr:ras-interacting protein RIP3-like [Chenopodium quinoa]